MTDGAYANQIEGCSFEAPNGAGSPLINSVGIKIQRLASENVIGGENAAQANVVSRQGVAGVLVIGTGTQGNHVVGNRFDRNYSCGIYIGFGATSNEIRKNQITRHSRSSEDEEAGQSSGAGVLISALLYTDTNSNTIVGNLFGTDSSGSALDNVFGVAIVAGANNNLVGGTGADANVFNGDYGVLVQGNVSLVARDDPDVQPGLFLTPTDNNKILGNFLGTNASGAKLSIREKAVWLRASVNHTAVRNNTIAFTPVGIDSHDSNDLRSNVFRSVTEAIHANPGGANLNSVSLAGAKTTILGEYRPSPGAGADTDVFLELYRSSIDNPVPETLVTTLTIHASDSFTAVPFSFVLNGSFSGQYFTVTTTSLKYLETFELGAGIAAP